ncbi:UNVERIFIED_CONTAM: Zeatin O-glucosyltransferase [Sesamum latifolium]|uniref:Zeatin O-glucosyltransferase n=1 Tax=Sesamum latifolium TaxID=2727402 RepID=A0AAW2VJI4_9LAMI
MGNHRHENGNDHKESQVAVVMVPLPAQGHLNQLLHLSRFVSAASIPVYYVGSARPSSGSTAGTLPQQLTSISKNSHQLLSATLHLIPINPTNSRRSSFHLFVRPYISVTFYKFVAQLSSNFRRVVVIYDYLMSYVVQDIGSLQNTESYCLRCVPAFTVYSFHWEAAGRPDDVPAEATAVLKEIPGLDGVFSPDFDEFRRVQNGSRKIFSGDIYNSSRAIDGGFYLDLVAERKITGTEKLWAVGPFNPVVFPEKGGSRTRHECLDWLDRQSPNSVIFVSFGTTSSLSNEKFKNWRMGWKEASRSSYGW